MIKTIFSVFCFWILISSKAFAFTDTLFVSNDIQLIKVDSGLYIHKTWVNSDKYGRFSSNGMLLISKGKALLVDTPNNNEQTQKLSKYINDSLKAEIEKVVVCHFHDDCLGGLDYLHQNGVGSIGGIFTKNICEQKKIIAPQKAFYDSVAISFYGKPIKCYYFGGGHTADNIVVYFDEAKLLFGGCLIKSNYSKGLGNTKDAIVEDWDKTIEKVKKILVNINKVVPGHGDIGDVKLLDHTQHLVQSYLLNNKL